MKRLIAIWHKIIAYAPSSVGRSYLLVLSWMCRQFMHDKLASKVRNSVASANWPQMELPPRSVRVGNETYIKLIPHIGEFDGDALFYKTMPYEHPVFAWLEHECAERYDMVIEIGANVGIYTTFLGKLIDSGVLKRVIAFEPAPKAYGRLIDNLKANDLLGNPVTFPAAVADKTGWLSFYEPSSHLTNGSLDPRFAAYFSETVNEIMVPAVDAAFLEALVLDGERVLMKIDVEGYEPQLLASLSGFIEKHKPDLIVEVLQETECGISEWLEGQSYNPKLFTKDGLRELSFCAHQDGRDWFFEYSGQDRFAKY
jgi:FkbM family methyltransferase